MTANGAKRKYEENGKHYRFNNIRFAEFIHEIVSNEKKNNPGTDCTQNQILEQIADEVGVSSDTVKKWLNSHGPGDLDLAKKCADYLQTDYHNLLISTDKENTKMTAAEHSFVNEVFGDIVAVIYDYTNFFLDRYEFNEETYQNPYNLDMEFSDKFRRIPDDPMRNDKAKLYLYESALKIHKKIDSKALEVSPHIRYTLQRIILELRTLNIEEQELILPQHWSSIMYELHMTKDNLTYGRYPSFYCCDYDNGPYTEKHAALWATGGLELSDEIQFAEKLGIQDEIVPIPKEIEAAYYHYDPEERRRDPDGYYEKQQKAGEYISDHCGYQGNLSLSAYAIFMDDFVNMLKEVFEYNFPELKEGN